MTDVTDSRKLAYETYRIGRNEYLVLCKYLSTWFMGENPEDLANKLFDVSVPPPSRSMIVSRLYFRHFAQRQIRMKLILLILFVYGIFY